MVVDTKITKNLFKLPSSASAIKAGTDQIKLNQSMLTKLDSACQNRRAAALELFKTEFTGVPECFVKDGTPFHATKSDILKSILSTSCNVDPSVSTDDQDGESFDVYIVDLSVQIRAKASVRDSLDKEMTYSQFCLSILNGACNFAKSIGAKRVDLVAVMYRIDSIKGPTREKRGTCTGIRFGAGDILPRKSKLDQYLKNDDFKVDINRLIVNVASDDLDTDLEFAITDGLKVLKVNEGVQIREVWSTIDDLMEEADNRVLLHTYKRCYRMWS